MKQRYSFEIITVRNTIDYFKKSTWWGVLEQVVSTLRAVCFVMSLWAMQEVFDRVYRFTQAQISILEFISYLLLLSVILIINQLLNGYGQYLMSQVSYSNMGKLMGDFQRKLGRIDPVHFEREEFLDQIERAKDCLEYEELGHLASITLQFVSYYTVLLLLVGFYLFQFSPLIPIIIVLSFIPLVLGYLLHYRQARQLEEETYSLRRQNRYYIESLIGPQFFKETRLLGGFGYFYHHFLSTLYSVVRKEERVSLKMMWIKLGLNLFSYLGFGFVLYLLFIELTQGRISIGVFSSIFILLSQFFSLVDELVSDHISGIGDSLSQVVNFYQLMDFPERGGNMGEIDFSKGLVADRVSFSYGESSQLILKELNLALQKGESIALVGANGSGKTTLIRLLLGLYTPTSGQVWIGDLGTQTTHQRSLFRRTSGVFQQFQRYKLSLLDNICISDWSKNVEESVIDQLLEVVGGHLKSIDKDMILAPEFGGINLSGGQWQRLAIARGLYREHDFIIMDEPTAAIDPKEEYRLYQMFEQIVAEKTSILVSHRLGSVRLASRIVVLDQGEIVEIGSHEELLAKKGKYFTMWNSQAKWYD
ncbi:ABC transporter ATP-binding protein [Streptococcus danieliae]|uniref:ABC transporter ATP-binding protein n=1 Tax=Streptococcus danieliae TaxID=747656 RepID=UPI0026EE6BCC|nr:ABC transporter ATP-binding protein [Streptococcus danieliae]